MDGRAARSGEGGSSLDALRAVLRADRARREAPFPWLLLDPIYRCTIVWRTYRHLHDQGGVAARVVRVPLGAWLRRARIRHGFDIDPRATVGPGLYLSGHPGGVVVHPSAVIGRDCNLAHGVTIGQANRGPRTGAPRIGDRVWIGAGAKLIGAISVGDGALIGPNCVVTEDVEAEVVLAMGCPVVVSRRGSGGYVQSLS